jgi:rhodanese-related sulfurtransferase
MVVVMVLASVNGVWAAAKLADNMTAKAANELLQKESKIIVLDVRTQGEFMFQGYVKGAYNVPYWFFGKKFVVKGKEYEVSPGMKKTAPMNRYQFANNPDFMTYVKKVVKPEDTVLIYCGSGARSAKAADDLVKAGYKDVINMLDGIEGKNGWKDSKLPLDYMMKVKNLDPKFVYPPDVQ